ncbi:MAG TPA: hypothetical protein PLI60_04955, partial [Anaerolineaceae bacterium]|nr:hypothetical protein [Anaerolineaceae bacterium]
MAVLTDRRETPRKKPESGFSKEVKKSVTAWIYILPAGLLMIIITMLPQVYQVWMAFTDYAIKNLRFNPFNPETAQFAPSMVGLQNFIDILQNNALQAHERWRHVAGAGCPRDGRIRHKTRKQETHRKHGT